MFVCQVGGKCLWFNESAPHVSTDMFIVQGAPGVWDMHCQYEASGPGVGQFPDLVSVRPQIPIPSLHAFANLTSCGKPLIEDLSGAVLRAWELLLHPVPVRSVPRSLPQDHHAVPSLLLLASPVQLP
eukprot:COSAG04_NODE_1633_length_6104_cov_3.956536_11_plen_127_part_00